MAIITITNNNNNNNNNNTIMMCEKIICVVYTKLSFDYYIVKVSITGHHYAQKRNNASGQVNVVSESN
jgi:hypothetical protein